MTKNPNKYKNTIDSGFFLRYLFALVPIKIGMAAFFSPPFFFFWYVKHKKKRSPGGNTINYRKKTRRAFVKYTMLHNVCK